MTTAFGTHNGMASTIELLQAELPQLESRQQALEKDLAAVSERLESVRTALRSLQALATVPSQGTPAAPAEPAAEAVHAPAAADASASAPAAEPAAPAKPAASSEPAADEAPAKAAGRRRKAPVPAPRAVDGDATTGDAATEDAPAVKKPGRRRAGGAAKTQRPAGRAAKPAASKPAAGPAAKPAKPTAAKRAVGLMDGVMECLSKSAEPMRAGEVNKILGREQTAGSINAVRTALERLAKASRVERVGRGLYRSAAG